MTINDSKIRDLLNRAETKLPYELDKRTTQMILDKKSTKSISFNWLWKASLIPAALCLIFALLIFFPGTSRHEQKSEEITEIRTEFLIKDKNIKIIWIQKKDFKLNLTKEKTL